MSRFRAIKFALVLLFIGVIITGQAQAQVALYTQKVIEKVEPYAPSLWATRTEINLRGDFDVDVSFEIRRPVYGCGELWVHRYRKEKLVSSLRLHEFTADEGCAPTDLRLSSGYLTGGQHLIVTLGPQAGVSKVVELNVDGKVIGTAAIPGTAAGSTVQSVPLPTRMSPQTLDPKTVIAKLYITQAYDTGLYSPGGIYQATLTAGGTLSPPTLIFTFPGGRGGYHVVTPAAIGPDGYLYGVTQRGGTSTPDICSLNASVWGCGVVYRLRPPATGTQWKEEVLHIFTGGRDGSNPNSELKFDSQGNVYGTTFIGGDLTSASAKKCVGPYLDAYTTGTTYGCGVVFRLLKAPTAPWKEQVLHVFHGSADGGQPYGSITLDVVGNVFGTTVAGGKVTNAACLSSALRDRSPGCGVVFKLTAADLAAAWPSSVLYAFRGAADGAQPQGPLSLLNDGSLLGTTLAGGNFGDGCDRYSNLGWADGCGVAFLLVKQAAP